MYSNQDFSLFQVFNNSMSLVVSKYCDKAQFNGCEVKVSLNLAWQMKNHLPTMRQYTT